MTRTYELSIIFEYWRVRNSNITREKHNTKDFKFGKFEVILENKGNHAKIYGKK